MNPEALFLGITIVKKHPFYLPACSGGHNQGNQTKQKQIITNSMMQAYNKMRGSIEEEGVDPLFEWIKEREEPPPDESPADKKKRISRMLEKIDEVLDPSNPAGHTPRDSIFEVERPSYEHLEVPPGMDMAFHRAQEIEAKKQVLEPDSDDEEAGVPSGRISPCTFLALSKGCVRWDDHENKVYIDETQATRLRPPTPEIPLVAKSRQMPSYCHERVEQVDEVSGGWLSPHYKVPSSPSLLFSAPGVPDDKFAESATFMGKFSRMDPLAAREMRDHMYGGNEDTKRKGKGPATVANSLNNGGNYEGLDDKAVDLLTFIPQSEIEEAALHTQGPGMGPEASTTLTAHLTAQWTSIAAAESCEAALRRAAAQQEARQQALENELQALRQHLVPQLRHRRAMRAAYERHQQQQQEERAMMLRRERIQEHMAQYLRDVQHRLDTAHLRAAEAQRRAEGRAAAIEDLEDDIAEVLLSVGARDAEQVYREIMEFDEWNSVLDRGFRPGVYGGFGGGSGRAAEMGGAADAAAAAGAGEEGGASASAYPNPNALPLIPLSPLSSLPPMPLEIGDGYQYDGFGGRSPIDATGFPSSADFGDAVDPDFDAVLERNQRDGNTEKGKWNETEEVVMNGNAMGKALPINVKTKENEIPHRAPKNEETPQYRKLPPLRLPSPLPSSARQVSEEEERTHRLSKVQKLFRRTAVETDPSETGGSPKKASPIRQVFGKGKEPTHRPSKEKGKTLLRRHETTGTTGYEYAEGVFAEGSSVFPEQFQGWDQ
ncbi:hypothetical protein SLS62_009300 [Diatrype stigma]|uniref:Uncharacterized protein n=1 Tax=Diatrype stigma TaxID=117547 RepID=A0AAN9UGC9_9PEZI